jgi:hypothetical protein
MSDSPAITGMHPGVINGRRVHPMVNTCGNSSSGKRLMKALAGIEGHLVEHPRDGVSAMRVSKIKSILSS